MEETVRGIVEARKMLSFLDPLSDAAQVASVEDGYRVQRAG